MKNEALQCEQFELMISEWIDGELTDDDSLAIQQHLGICIGCRQSAGSFEQVNAAVVGLSAGIGRNASEANIAKVALGPPQRNMSSRTIALAVAAVVLLALIIAIPLASPPATANDFSPQQIAHPLKELHVLNMHQQRDQALMLKTLNMDLRAMKLELNQIQDSKEQGNLQNEIDLMLAKVQQFDSL